MLGHKRARLTWAFGMLGSGSALLPLPGAAALSDLADLSDLAGLSDLMPAKLLSKEGKSWLTAQTSSAIHAGLADFFDFLALPPFFGGILIPQPEVSLDRATSRYAYMFSS